MAVLALGVSYRRASVELLERLAFADEDLPKAYHHLASLPAVSGAVVLSTCNRVEVFAEVEAYHAGFRELKAFLAESREVPTEAIDDPLYSHYEDQAAEHLFSVAAGIDSMVVGEPQILSQVRRALRLAEAEGAPSALLTHLFRHAVRVGRRARAETRIGASPAAFVEAGAILAERHLDGLRGRNVVLVGAGGMAEIAAWALAGRGVGPVTVVNRSVSRAERLAGRTGATAAPLDRMDRALSGADLVVSSTGAAGIVVDRETVGRAMASRAGRPMFLLDLAVPRDVDPDVAALPGVALADIDDLRAVVPAEDVEEVGAVREIVGREVARFADWRRGVRMAPLIRALLEEGDRVREAELRRAARRLASLSEKEREAVEQLTEAIVAKLLHHPVAGAKRISDPGDPRARLLAELFGIEPPGGP
ncbi:MAG: glutamyl-tRNA reductase [Actinobacteria bacterium]|nr:glutamyl-tRNA reductase [Actinomycetota bacterium]